ncbi:MAG: gliding motility-associated C-terminal domain-containing protein [Cryomorphaceae bacterium]
MSKDLFEQQIGEALRKAESTPPAGAWEMIKSQIATPYTPPFKFPTWTVVVISTVLLGGMALTNQSPEDSVSNDLVATVSVEEDQENETSVAYANAVTQESVASEAAPTAETEVQIILAEKTETTADDDSPVMEESMAEESPSANLNDHTESKINSTMPIQVEAAKPLQALVEQEEEVAPELNEGSFTQPSTSTIVESKLSIEGANTCYTPCKLNLSAKGNAVEYSWDAASFGLIEGKNLTLTIDEPQSFTVYASATFADGSERSVPKTVEVKAGSELFVPNSFTPNGDGVNDSYMVRGSGIETFSMTIVNSKGKVVFQTSNINEAWKFEGSSIELDNEFYTAIVRAVGVDGKVIAKNERLIINP